MNLNKVILSIFIVMSMVHSCNSGPIAAAAAALTCCGSTYWLVPVGIPACSLDSYSCPPTHPPFHVHCGVLSAAACMLPTP